MRPTPIAGWLAATVGSAPGALTRADLERYQLDRLRETIRYARERSRFYGRHLAGTARDIDSLADLAGLPFTTATDLRESGPRFLCVSQDEIARVVTLDTSGTTGAPKRLYFTRADQESTVEFFRVGMSTFTEPGDTVMILLPVERPGSVGDLLATALERVGARPVRHGVVDDVPATLAVMRRERVTGLVGIPTQVLALARRDGGLRLSSVLLSTDHVAPAVARAVEQAWSCRVYNHYGMTEMGLGAAVECRARCGYHLREADLYFEIVDPVTGTPVPDGAPGEIVFTTLTRRGAPLIRYRTGDLSRFLPGTCPCGVPLRRLERIEARVDGRVPIGYDDRLTMAELDEALFSVRPVVDFSATVSHDPRRPPGPPRACLRLEVGVIEGPDNAVASAIDAALESVPAIRRARESGQLRTSVRVVRADSIAARPAKRRMMDVRNHA